MDASFKSWAERKRALDAEYNELSLDQHAEYLRCVKALEDEHLHLFAVGMTLQGTVMGRSGYGVFVSLAGVKEGLIHWHDVPEIDETMSLNGRERRLKSLFPKDTKLAVTVNGITQDGKISLALAN